MAGSQPEHEHALTLLRGLGFDVGRIVAVHADGELPEAFLYLTKAGRPRTVWVDRKDGQPRSRCSDDGFPAYPSRP